MKPYLSLCFALLLGLFSVPAFASKVEIAVSVAPVIDTPYGQGHVYWAKIIDEQSNGSIKLNIFPSEQLGSTNDNIDQAVFGDPIILSTDASLVAELGVPDMAIVQAPYLCRTWEEMDRLMASDWWRGQEKLLEQKGLKVLARNWRYGDRHTITTRKVVNPADIKGMKIRVPRSLVYVKSFEALGAVPTPLALSEVYSALQQGTIEGLENPLAVIDGNKYQEVAKFLLLDSHMKTINLTLCGTAFFNTLSSEQQALLMKTAQEAGDYQNKLAADHDAKLIAKLKSQGVTITEIDYDAYAGAVTGFYAYPEFAKWTPGLHDTIKKILGR